MAAARAAEYRTVLAQALEAASLRPAERARVGGQLRTELRRIRRRDYFPPADRDAAVTAVEALVRNVSGEWGRARDLELGAGSTPRGGRS
jgi:hypothetical protein